MFLMIFTIIGLLIIIAGLYTKYALPVKYVLLEGECAKSRSSNTLDLTKCTETTREKGLPVASSSASSGVHKGLVYNSDPAVIVNNIFIIGSLILFICALVYGYKKFISKK